MMTKNPLVPATFRQWFREKRCEWFGHIEYGAYFIAPQAWCARCGRRNDYHAAKGVPKWKKPDD